MSLNTQMDNQLRAALIKRESLRKDTDALRLVNSIGDQLEGLVLEQYGKHFVVQVFNVFWLNEASCLKDFLREHFDVEYYIVKDRTQSASSNPEAIKFQILVPGESRTIVHEHNLSFEVDLQDTLNTGLFLDMRSNRWLVAQSCQDKKVLNGFSYTCSFGVYARAHGARDVVNVDVSKKILEKGRRNYHLNNLDPQKTEFIRADAMEYLEVALKKDNRFDIIILDPPSFARAEGKVFSIEKNLPRLIELAVKVLNEKGKLFVSTNFSGITNPKLEGILKAVSGARRPKKITKLGQDKDFIGSGQTKESHLAALWVEY
ncbi:MAG: class I SAM-dependent rRNA methyltransferase [Candidatus Omnitrophica bacterium]|nr:class I SAM-dependent rRNA methyltransferase [Candidatus Omnitrophota bacterium]